MIKLTCGLLAPVALASASAAVLVTGLMAIPCVNGERPPKIKFGVLKNTAAPVFPLASGVRVTEPLAVEFTIYVKLVSLTAATV